LEGRVLVTLDLEFGNVQAYAPSRHAGIIVLRPKLQDKRTVLMLMERIVSALTNRTPAGELWIVEPDRIRASSDLTLRQVVLDAGVRRLVMSAQGGPNADQNRSGQL